MADNTPLSDDWLAQQLRQSEPYIHDNGFTETVIDKLPQRPVSNLLHYGLLLLTLLTSLLIVAWHFPILGLIIDAGVSLSQLNLMTLVTSAVLFASVSTVVAVWALNND